MKQPHPDADPAVVRPPPRPRPPLVPTTGQPTAPPARRHPRAVLVVTWCLAVLALGWQLLQGRHGAQQIVTLPTVLVAPAYTAALLWWLGPILPTGHSDAGRTRRGWFLLTVSVVVVALVLLAMVVGAWLLAGVPLVAAATLIRLRARPPAPEVRYAAVLALTAGLAGLGAEWIPAVSPFSLPAWAGLQVALVLLGLLAGWAILRRTGLLEAGIGRSLWLTEGKQAALRGLGQGILVGTPLALGIVVMGAAEGPRTAWVREWWQPLVSIQPGIAEEAWARVLLVPLLFLAFRRVAGERLAVSAAVGVAAYWFAFLHAPGDVISTLVVGTLYVLPLSLLWLRRGLETAISAHVWMDFLRFLVAYLLNQGLWPG